MNRADYTGRESPTLVLRRQGIVRALEAMRLRLADPVTLEYLAKTAAMSRFHFERVFRQMTGLAPFQFLSAMRLVRARDLVLTTDASITAICFDVGYSSMGTFTRRFTASVGVSPRRLRWFSRHRHAGMAGAPVAADDHAAGPPTGSGSDVVVHCRGAADDTRIFVGVFPLPAPIGRPAACATATGATTVVLPDVPPGSYYVLAAACPPDGDCGRFAGIDTVVGIADPAPLQVDRRAPQEVTMQLRPADITDPPIVSFLPLLFHEICAHPPRGTIAPCDRCAGSPRAARAAAH
jgi:AraC-like DNA-binding protein